ncbi:hypothetical protein HOLleu_13952 [Holothuria leucospilota]|uniref:Uncharacterized protein n=1 Tax=Holothuria leucospilota TaxID=206669 RepID=A0A9Q1C869_HOLLE|nr:hypothetical protein HOLleu_13952 [Holothuria leucospilota]
MERDHKDMQAIISFLQHRDPFADDQSLRNIETGVTADQKATTMNIKTAIQADGEAFDIDLLLLFQRLITASSGMYDDKKEIFRQLPFVHAFTGCDTTSHPFGISKGAVLRKMMTDKDFQKTGKVFSEPASKEVIIKAGE